MAAGQSNVDDRNRDFAMIYGDAVFKRGRTVPDHDHFVFFGDFNFRVDMENDAVRTLLFGQSSKGTDFP